MTESRDLRDRVDVTIRSLLAHRLPILTRVSPELAPVADLSLAFLSGGKRLRARFAYQGWESQAGSVPDSGTAGGDAIDAIASSLEIFHAAALIHDDLIDNSDTRRGAPSAHRQFQSYHRSQNWVGDAEAYGRSSALLLGDLLLGWSNELFDEGLRSIESAELRRRLRNEYAFMRTEVTAGQYLDIAEESSWPHHADEELYSRALGVLIAKSARYSVEHPLVLGAMAAGADDTHLAALRDFALPIGIAFQLRDDQLGVFGDSAVTGKPAGDDIGEGKRTVLIALAMTALDDDRRAELNSMLGNADIDQDAVAAAQEIIRSSGAEAAVEDLITENVEAAREAIATAGLRGRVADDLNALALAASRRNA